jgi:predicted amidohydrolase YtcJ
MRTIRTGLCVLLGVCAMTGCAGSSADLVVVNGRVWTGCEAGPEAEAIAVVGERIVLVGSDVEVRERIGCDTRVIDAGGRLVVPGLTDCHTHIISGGLQLERLYLRNVADKDEFIAAVADAARSKRAGQWVLGGRWSVESWADPQPPTKEWIDPVTGDTPVFLVRMDGHQALANSAALKLAGIDRSGLPDPLGGEIERDPVTGEPTGILKDDAKELVRLHIPEVSDADRDAALLRAMAHANRLGITGVHDMSDPDDLASFVRVRDAGRATVRIRSFIMDDDWPGHYATARDFRNDDWVTVGGLKGFMDGSLGSRTACMHEPYADAGPDEKYPCGLLVAMADPPEKMKAAVQAADEAGFQVVVHAIGDRANTLLLDSYEAAAEIGRPRDRRHRVEHAQHLTAKDIKRFGPLGVIASMQPLHKADDARYAEQAIGSERVKTSYAYRSLLDAGAKVCFGSDWPVVSINPYEGMASAVTARTLDGKVWLPEQSITVEEALRAYTVMAAYAGFAEDRLGTLEAGKLADIVILDRDPLTIPPDELGKVAVTHTIVGGRLVWTAGQDSGDAAEGPG